MKRKTVLGFVALSVLLLVPSVVLTATGNSALSSTALLAGISGLIAGLGCGTRVGVLASLAMGAAGALGLAAASQPLVAALVMGVFVLGVGFTARAGMSANLIMFPISLGFVIAVPVIGKDGLLYPGWSVVAVLVVVSAYAAVLGSYLGHRLKLPEPALVSTTRAAAFALTLALMASFATWLVVDRDLRHGGAWMIMTVLVVYRPYLQDAISITFQRAGGTVLGCAVAAGFGLVGLPRWVDVIAGLALLTLALIVRAQPSRPYWQYSGLMAATVVLLEGAGDSVLSTDWQRIVYTLLGASLAVAVELLLVPFYKRTAKAAGLAKY